MTDPWLMAIAGGLLAIAARIVWVGVRRAQSRSRLRDVLDRLGVAAAQIRVSGAYGWPRYEVTFRSPAERDAFNESPAFNEFLAEVQVLHNHLTVSGQRFNARAAVSLLPYRDTRSLNLRDDDVQL